MKKALAAYAATALVMVVLDLLWLGLIATSIYQQAIGHLMADSPRVGVAVLFYALYAAGLVVFAVLPANRWQRAALMGGLFGFFAYSTYDLTNLATLKDWPVGIALLDMAWGTLVSAVSAGAGCALAGRLERAWGVPPGELDPNRPLP